MHVYRSQRLRMGTARMKEDEDTEEDSKDGLTISWAYRSPWSLLPEAVGELPN